MSPIDKERMDVAHAAVERLLNGLKTKHNLRGKELHRMKLIEAAAQALETAWIL